MQLYSAYLGLNGYCVYRLKCLRLQDKQVTSASKQQASNDYKQDISKQAAQSHTHTAATLLTKYQSTSQQSMQVAGTYQEANQGALRVHLQPYTLASREPAVFVQFTAVGMNDMVVPLAQKSHCTVLVSRRHPLACVTSAPLSPCIQHLTDGITGKPYLSVSDVPSSSVATEAHNARCTWSWSVRDTSLRCCHEKLGWRRAMRTEWGTDISATEELCDAKCVPV